MDKFTYRERTFLMPESTGIPSFIMAEVQSSNGGKDKWGHNMITLGDCRRQILLEFILGTRRNRKHSLAKIDLLLKVLGSFRSALLVEAKLIEADSRSTKRSTGSAKKAGTA